MDTTTAIPRRLAATAVTAAVLAGGLLVAPAAQASGGDDVRRSGSCSAGSTWKLKAKPDNGRLEVEGEVDSNVNGQTWTWRILRNGTVVERGTKQTAGPSGSFSVSRRIANPAGSDRIGWRASNAATGETCSGSLTI